jgi:hypothetical protein
LQIGGKLQLPRRSFREILHIAGARLWAAAKCADVHAALAANHPLG